jgi:hypothetical protein
MKKVEERVFVVPELQVRVNESWVRLVRWCQVSFPHGDLKIRIVNAQPTELLEERRRIRFDKEDTLSSDLVSPFQDKDAQ